MLGRPCDNLRAEYCGRSWDVRSEGNEEVELLVEPSDFRAGTFGIG